MSMSLTFAILNGLYHRFSAGNGTSLKDSPGTEKKAFLRTFIIFFCPFIQCKFLWIIRYPIFMQQCFDDLERQLHHKVT